MNTRNFLASLAIIFILSILGMSLWLYEIVEIKKWNSLDWLRTQLYSPYISASFSVLAFMTPFFINKQLSTKKAIVSGIIFYLANIICFKLGKEWCYEPYRRSFIPEESLSYIIMYCISPFLLYIILGSIYQIITHKFIKRNKKVNILTLTLILLMAIPLSLLTIEINSGFSQDTGLIHTIKMGYPVFWTTMALGLSGIIISRQKNYIE